MCKKCGETCEFTLVENNLERAKVNNIPVIAMVGDTYDIFKFTERVTSGEFRDKIESAAYPTFVIRPDSGDPMTVINKLLDILERNVAYTINSKGYKVFNKYRLIWGDGITPKTILRILNMVIEKGYSAENIAFGSGGDIMQNLNRDTCKFAIKCSAAKINDKWTDVMKDPITDPGKKSKTGVLTSPDLTLVFRNGIIVE